MTLKKPVPPVILKESSTEESPLERENLQDGYANRFFANAQNERTLKLKSICPVTYNRPTIIKRRKNKAMKIFTRKVEEKDYQFIADLSNQLGYKTTYTNTQRRLEELINNDDNCVFVAVDNDKVVGWIHGCYSLRVESDPYVEIGGLVIDKNYRRMGIGKVLVEKIVEWTASKQCSKVRVRSNVMRNEAHAFYKGIGFYESKEQKVFAKSLG